MLLFITIILILIFLCNYFLYWVIFFKTPRKMSKIWDFYTNIYLIIWISIIIIIPIITSSYFKPFFGTNSYFQELLPGFFLLGLILVGLGIKIVKLAMTQNKLRGFGKGNYRLIKSGIYGVMRHPMNNAWALIFIGLAFIFDSFISLILSPIFVLLLYFECILEEKYLLLPQFNEYYLKYKEKTPSRLFPTPYNFVLGLITIFVLYVGLLNFFTKA